MPASRMTDTLSILDIRRGTTVDGPGFRTSVYTAGCSHHCLGCHNPESWKLSAGVRTSLESILKVIEEETFSNVTLSGGDPLYQVEEVTELCRMIKERTRKNIWLYTGYTFEAIVASQRLSMILPYVDVIVDGPFIREKKDEQLLFRGSGNQRLIDVPRTLLLCQVCAYECP